MAYQRIRQPKLSDVIEQELERLIVEGTLAPVAAVAVSSELAKQFDVSRPSIREAIQRLEAKRLLTRRQGGGTFVSENIWKKLFRSLSFNLLSSHSETQLDLLNRVMRWKGFRFLLRGIAWHRWRLCCIQACQEKIHGAQEKGDIEAESAAVMAYCFNRGCAQCGVIAHCSCLAPLLEQNVLENLKLLHRRKDVVEKVSIHRANIVDAIVSGQPEKAREMSHSHLAYIEETLLDLTKEASRRERSLRRIQQG